MTTLVSMAPLLAASCCVNKHVETSGQAPLDPPEETTAAQTEQPPVDPSNPSQRPCSPTPPTASTQCSNSERNTICVPFTGDVYIWSRSAGCRKRIHSKRCTEPMLTAARRRHRSHSQTVHSRCGTNYSRCGTVISHSG